MAKKLSRWNWKTHEYEDFDVPDNRVVGTYAFDLDSHIDCASCGASITYGLSYTSLEIHTRFGIGYCVCQQCHEEECKRRFKYGN